MCAVFFGNFIRELCAVERRGYHSIVVQGRTVTEAAQERRQYDKRRQDQGQHLTGCPSPILIGQHGCCQPRQCRYCFFALCFGDNAPTRAAAGRFVDCFYKTETRTRMVTVTQEDGTEELVEETYEVAVPLPMAEVYEKLSIWRGRVVTDAERSNAVDIYVMVMGSMGGDTFNGAYEPGGSAPIELDVSMLTDPTTKNAADLVTYVTNAWNSGWGYVWGTFGQVLTPELLQYKISQYPEGVGDEADFIRSHWLNRRTTDCVGLIKGYGWLNTVTMEIQYGSNGM